METIHTKGPYMSTSRPPTGTSNGFVALKGGRGLSLGTKQRRKSLISMFICHILSLISHFHASMLRWLDCLPSPA